MKTKSPESRNWTKEAIFANLQFPDIEMKLYHDPTHGYESVAATEEKRTLTGTAKIKDFRVSLIARLFDSKIELSIRELAIEDPRSEDKDAYFLRSSSWNQKSQSPFFVAKMHQTDPSSPEFKSVFHQTLLNLDGQLEDFDFYIRKETFIIFIEFLLNTFVPEGTVLSPMPSLYKATSRFASSFTPEIVDEILANTKINFVIKGINLHMKSNHSDIGLFQ